MPESLAPAVTEIPVGDRRLLMRTPIAAVFKTKFPRGTTGAKRSCFAFCGYYFDNRYHNPDPKWNSHAKCITPGYCRQIPGSVASGPNFPHEILRPGEITGSHPQTSQRKTNNSHPPHEVDN